MRRILAILSFGSCVLVAAGCGEKLVTGSHSDFQKDLEFLRKHVDVILLTSRSGSAQVAVVPAWQGRVMTSTNAGSQGPSFGWINYDLIRADTIQPHINPYGGEDRFWMGPEGGQYGIFFKRGDPFDLEHWQTPACIDTEAWDAISPSRESVSFSEEVSLVNYSGTRFDLRIERTVKLLTEKDVSSLLDGTTPESVDVVGFASENRITNLGDRAWEKETGLLSIWILGMYVPSASTTVILPFRQGSQDRLGPVVNDAYFGKVPDERLEVKGSAVYFKADGRYRSKIGLNPQRALTVAGSYDSLRNLLTIVQYDQPEGAIDYVNSMWEIQEQPYAGDVINSYNDGPPAPGAEPMGPFYELETSSPAAALKPGESLAHTHRTYHFTGPSKEIDEIANRVLGIRLEDIP